MAAQYRNVCITEQSICSIGIHGKPVQLADNFLSVLVKLI